MWANIDSDSVVYCLQDETARVARLMDPSREYPMPDQWDMAKCWGVDKAFMSQMWATPGLYRNGNPIEGAVEGVKALAQRYDIRIITHKHGMPLPDQAMAETIAWYADVGLLGMVDIVIPRGSKAEYKADLTIDDQPDLKWAQPGALNILFDQPWNENIVVEAYGCTINRAYGWDAVLDFVYG